MLPDAVRIYGGFPNGGGNQTFGARDPYVYPTRLVGDFGTRPTERVYHVVTAPPGTTSATLLDGVQIKKGRADGSGTNESKGAGLLIYATSGTVSSPRVVRCQFENNYAVEGGAVAINGLALTSEPVFVNCEFMTNTATSEGSRGRKNTSTCWKKPCVDASTATTDCPRCGDRGRDTLSQGDSHCGCAVNQSLID